MGKSIRIVGIIPSRYASTRLPGKPLVDIGGIPMIVRVYKQAIQAAHLYDVIVATDNERIVSAVVDAGGKAVMTPSNLASGTDRIAYVAKNIDADIFVNIQGDEPFIAPIDIDRTASILVDDSDASAGTLVKRITNTEELTDPNIVKVVIDKYGRALYFSRSVIPYQRDVQEKERWLNKSEYFKHIGIYSYTREFLLKFKEMGISQLERAEKLEQLRVLENGYFIKVLQTENEPLCVDTPEDLRRAREFLEKS